MISPTLIALVASLLCPTPTPDAPGKTMTLKEAIDSKIVTVEAVSLGGHQGKCVELKVINPKTKKFSISVPAGTLFDPADEGEQSLVLPEERMLSLNGKATQRFKIDGFCTEASDMSPSSGGMFTLNNYRKPAMDSVFAFLDAHPKLAKNEDLIQQTIWAITDGESVSSIYSDDDATHKEAAALRALVCRVTGQENVWYNTRENVTVDHNNYIVSQPVAINGQLEIKLEQRSTIQGVVQNAEGEEMWVNTNSFEMPRGNIKFSFQVEIAGWEPGTYYVVYHINEEEVLRQEFQV